MSISEKLQVIAENQELVYQVGYDKGYSKGYSAGNKVGVGNLVGDTFTVSCNYPPKTIKVYENKDSVGIRDYHLDGYTELETVYVPMAKYVGECAFRNCTKLANIGLGCEVLYYEDGNPVEWYGLVTVSGSAFSGCTSLRNCSLHFDVDSNQRIGSYAFKNCTNLEQIDLKLFAGEIASNAFDGCNNLKTLIIRNEVDTASLPSRFYNSSIEQTGYIYIPSKFLSDYQAACQNYASQFRALEDYTVDGTLYGEFDETKI